MTNITKNRTVVITFAALLMVMPLASSNVFATEHRNNDMEGTADLLAVCGIFVSENIDFGQIAPGVDSKEVDASVTTRNSSIDGFGISVTGSDWIGTDSGPASGEITVSNVLVGNTVVIGDITYIAVAQGEALNPVTPTSAEFNINSENDVTTVNLASAISSADAGTTMTISQPKDGKFTVTAIEVGDSGNSILFASESNPSTISVSGSGTLEGGTDGVTHLLADVTKFSFTTDGTTVEASDYASKTSSLGVTPVDLTTDAQIDQNIALKFQITTFDTLKAMPYSGDLTQQITFTTTC